MLHEGIGGRDGKKKVDKDGRGSKAGRLKGRQAIRRGRQTV